MHATARESQPTADSEQSSVRRRQSATRLSSAAATAPVQQVAAPSRSGNLASKIATARSLQTLVPEESREAQLLAIAILRRDEALLDELIRRVSRR
jgi:hypothetical protein